MYKYNVDKKKITITTTVSTALDKRFKKSGIKRSYALAYGMRKLLGDEVAEIDDSYVKLKDKVEKMAYKIGDLIRQTWKQDEEIKKLKKVEK